MQIIFDDNTYDWTSTSLEDLLIHHTPSGWTEFFNNELIKDRIHTISNYLRYEASHDGVIVYPAIDNVFRALYSIDLYNLDLVVIGQDPYHDGAATGLAFDVGVGRKMNPSLRNILRELDSCGFQHASQTNRLTHWPDQGILMINTALTVRKGCPDSHTEIWSEFTEELIKYISNKKQLVWLLMGTHAQSFAKSLPTSKNHVVIRTTHPSPLAAFRSTKRAPAFIGSDCFKTINEALIRIGKEPIKF